MLPNRARSIVDGHRGVRVGALLHPIEIISRSVQIVGYRETGELQERRLGHHEEAEKFYRNLTSRGTQVRVRMEARGHAHWFDRLLNFELWIGDVAKIRAKGDRCASWH